MEAKRRALPSRNLTPTTACSSRAFIEYTLIELIMATLINPGEHPDYLREKVQALTEVEETIKTLENQLLAARKIRESIVRDIAVFHASCSPIHKLPLEILPLIFEGWENDFQIRNSTLCLVCKTWYEIVWNSAGLWSHILLRPNSRVNNQESMSQYAELSHRRAQNRPLEVTFDFSAVPSYPLYIGKILDDYFGNFKAFSPPNAPPGFLDWSILIEGTEQMPMYPYEEDYEGIPNQFARSIVEESRDYLGHWTSLNIVQGWREDAILPILFSIDTTERMKNLQEVYIQRDVRRSRGGQHETLIVLPSFFNLRRFTTNHNIGFHPNSNIAAVLEHLILDNREATLRFLSSTLPDFSALVTLELLFGEEVEAELPSRTFKFPRLSSLKLSGRDSKRFGGLINAPALSQLNLVQTKLPFHMFKAPFFANLTSLLIQGSASRVVATNGSVYMSSKALKSSLRQSPLLNSLRVCRNDWGTPSELMKTITEVREEGYSLRHLRDVIIVDAPWRERHGIPYRDLLTDEKRYLTVLSMPGCSAVGANAEIQLATLI